MFQFNVSITEEEFLQFNEYHILHSEKGKQAVRLYRLLTPIISLILIFAMWISEVEQEILIAEIITLSVLSIVMAFLSRKLLLKSIKMTIKRLKKNGKLPYNKESIITFEENTIREKTPQIETSIQYSTIERIDQGDEALYIYIGAIQALILPYQFFESDEQKKELITFLNSKIQIS